MGPVRVPGDVADNAAVAVNRVDHFARERVVDGAGPSRVASVDIPVQRRGAQATVTA